MDVFIDGREVVIADFVHLRDVPVFNEFALEIVVSGREGHDLITEPDKVFGLRCKADGPILVITIVEGTNTDGVTGGDVLSGRTVEENHGKLGVESLKHSRSVFIPEGEEQLTVGVTLEFIAPFDKVIFYGAEPVNFTVAHHIVRTAGLVLSCERLHALRGKAHNGQAMEPQKTFTGLHDPRHVRSTGNGLVKTFLQGFQFDYTSCVPKNRTH